MAKTFKVSIVTAEQTLLETEAVSLTLPGIAGYLGILANHAPLVTALVPGVLTLREDDGGPASVFAVTNGFVEVALNEVSVMVDACEPAPDIDVTRAEVALERAKERLAHRSDHHVDVTRADAAMARAKARLMAARKPN
jgi:F-type H+-transporting ATPase subunit epsilon